MKNKTELLPGVGKLGPIREQSTDAKNESDNSWSKELTNKKKIESRGATSVNILDEGNTKKEQIYTETGRESFQEKSMRETNKNNFVLNNQMRINFLSYEDHDMTNV